MKLVIISPSRTVENETKIVTALFEHGLETFHLRKPDMRTKEMRAYLENIPHHFRNRIVIHSHHALASAFGLKGIHLTRHHRKKNLSTWIRLNWMKLKNSGLTVSTSFHKIGSLYENKKKFDYVILGSIFDNVSGKFNAGFNEHTLRAALPKSCCNVIARGGCGIDNLSFLHDAGFAGAIFYSAVWKQTDPVEAFCSIVSRCRELNISIS